MQKIEISSELKDRVPDLQLFCIESDVVFRESPVELLHLLEDKCRELAISLKMDDISRLPAIKASRNGYKATGKDPARYRLSAEALLRRVVKGEELYRIGNVVDLLNLVSLSTGFSIGGYDLDSINGDIRFGIGKEGEPYTAIGRGEFNIEGLPVFRDSSGPFGSPTSDSERTRVTAATRRFLMIIIDFGVSDLVQEAGDMAVSLLKEFADSQHLRIQIIH